MKSAVLLTALMSVLSVLFASAAWAADPKVKMSLFDHSNGNLITDEAAKAVMAETLPAAVWKLHPASRYAFVSQVEGGMKGTTCVVTARVMLVPLTTTVRAVLFRPVKMATTYDALPNSSTDACQVLAKDKLKEATSAVASSIVKI